MIMKRKYIAIMFLLAIILGGMVLTFMYALQFLFDGEQFYCQVGNYGVYEVGTDDYISFPVTSIRVDITDVNQSGVFASMTKKFLNGTENTDLNVQVGFNYNLTPYYESAFNDLVRSEEIRSHLKIFKVTFLKPNWELAQRMLIPQILNDHGNIIESYELTNHGYLYLKRFSVTSDTNDAMLQLRYKSYLTYYFDFKGRLIRLINNTQWFNASSYFEISPSPLKGQSITYDLSETDLYPAFVIPPYPIFYYIWAGSIISCGVLIFLTKKGVDLEENEN